MDTLQVAAGTGVGGALVGIVTAYLMMQGKLRHYIREQAGVEDTKKIEIHEQPISIKSAIVYAEKADMDRRFTEMEAQVKELETKVESSRAETKSDLNLMRTEASEGRKAIRIKIETEAHLTNNNIINLTAAVSELKGEIKGLR